MQHVLRLLESRDYARDRTGKVTLRFHLNSDGGVSEIAFVENSVDLALEFSRRLPLEVISDLLGLPHEDRAEFADLARRALSLNSTLERLPSLGKLLDFVQRPALEIGEFGVLRGKLGSMPERFLRFLHVPAQSIIKPQHSIYFRIIGLSLRGLFQPFEGLI